jgi:hypothetical protein
MAHGGFFREQETLAADFRLIAIDLRGHGESQSAPAPTVERIAADVAELVEALDLEGRGRRRLVAWCDRPLAGPRRPAAARFAGAVVIDMTARVRNDAAWDLGLSPEACAARSLAIRDDYRKLRLFRRPGDLRPAGRGRRRASRELGVAGIRPQRRRRDGRGLGDPGRPGHARAARDRSATRP